MMPLVTTGQNGFHTLCPTFQPCAVPSQGIGHAPQLTPSPACCSLLQEAALPAECGAPRDSARTLPRVTCQQPGPGFDFLSRSCHCLRGPQQTVRGRGSHLQSIISLGGKQQLKIIKHLNMYADHYNFRHCR